MQEENGTMQPKINNEDNALAKISIGETMSLQNVNDPVFAERMMGEGYAIEPLDGKIYSPINGKVTFISDSKHAIGIEDENGIEILVHMGIDTVELKEEVFNIQVKQEEEVRVGQFLAQMNIDAIRNSMKEITTMVVITNTQDKIKDFKLLSDNEASVGEKVAIFKLK
ncbi:PTS sugar transporter subunit IIA [Staphylococcus devriesei]|uniref:PTS sugar transporter subunit IIA n=1 Tax=Staphylococcus devriesei TaxID=586733 RepID=UPI001F1D0338|nr:PTS glucose transporter subunit IIA [Staphylococcus devriesei]MCE5090394.1 PTS glucose transporter subunit IIA [Staphylococcus devriesei]